MERKSRSFFCGKAGCDEESYVGPGALCCCTNGADAGSLRCPGTAHGAAFGAASASACGLRIWLSADCADQSANSVSRAAGGGTGKSEKVDAEHSVPIGKCRAAGGADLCCPGCQRNDDRRGRLRRRSGDCQCGDLHLLQSMERQAKEEQERALLRQQMEIQTGSILSLEKSYRTQRRATHEFRNQLQTIHDLLARGAKDEALSYVEQLQGMQTGRVFAVNTHHPILDAVLNQKYQQAQEADTEIQFRVNNLSTLNMKADALVVLFSNLLDNAIEGCGRLPDGRTIHCSILLSDSLYISIRNTSPPVVIRGNEIPTTKEPKQDHGYGLSSVRRILDSIHGEYAFDYCDGWFQFVAEIPL